VVEADIDITFFWGRKSDSEFARYSSKGAE
jgi:hypothetical protein